MKLLTAGLMREADEAAVRQGVSTIRLMDRAGEQTARLARRIMEERGLAAAVAVCGKGNNGGDGLAAALHLRRLGTEARVIMLCPAAALSGDPAAMLARARDEGVPVATLDDPRALARMLRDEGESVLLIDALFGTGFHGPAREPWAAAIEALNGSGKEILSIDLPSGLDADTGMLIGPAVKAGWTLTLGAPKPALFITPASGCAGRVILADIGHPPGLLEAGTSTLVLLEAGWARATLAVRAEDSHKGSYGHVLVVAGSRTMPGAALLTALGAVRSGAGLVTLASPGEVGRSLAAALPEALQAPLPDDAGILSPAAAEAILALAGGTQALVMGPGLSAGPGMSGIIHGVLASVAGPVVLDADGLNALAGDPSPLGRAQPTIVTPHPGELGRLTGRQTTHIQADRLTAARDFADQSGAVTVLKGAGTLVALPSGPCMINSSGNPGMASGGMGDVLAGLIGGFLAQGYDPMTAAGLGVYLHGLAGDLAASDIGPCGFTAREVADRVPKAMAAVLEGHEDLEAL